MATATRIKVADQVWIALALLTREQPERDGFTAKEIIERVRTEFGRAAASVSTHVSGHCVASKPPSPGRYRMITKTDDGKLRLFRPGDSYNAEREGGKVRPAYDEVPEQYHELLEWYEVEYAASLKPFTPQAYDGWVELAEFASRHRGPGYSDANDVSARVDHYLVEAWFNRATRRDKPPSGRQ